MKRIMQGLAIGVLGMLGLATAAQAQWVHFHNVCSPGGFRVCASADIMVDPSNNLVIRVWNMNQSTLGSATIADYGSATGGWHTITSIGISNIGYTVATPTSLTANLIGGSTPVPLDQWTTGKDPTSASSIQLFNSGASVQNGHKEGIVGCLDPGPSSAGHVLTCNSYGTVPYVEFRISGFSSVDLANAQFQFHSQQVASSGCAVFDPKNPACTANSLKGSGSNEVIPEPLTVVLLGTGLLGVGGAAHRRRRRLTEENG